MATIKKFTKTGSYSSGQLVKGMVVKVTGSHAAAQNLGVPAGRSALVQVDTVEDLGLRGEGYAKRTRYYRVTFTDGSSHTAAPALRWHVGTVDGGTFEPRPIVALTAIPADVGEAPEKDLPRGSCGYSIQSGTETVGAVWPVWIGGMAHEAKQPGWKVRSTEFGFRFYDLEMAIERAATVAGVEGPYSVTILDEAARKPTGSITEPLRMVNAVEPARLF